MKLKMELTTKVITISILFALLIVFFVLQFKESKNFRELNTEVKLYNYNCSSDIKYSVNLLENTVYDTQVLSQDGYYMPLFVDNIPLSFSHQLVGDKQSKIVGKYNIIGTLKGTISNQDKIHTLWSKSFTLKPDTSIYDVNSSKQIIEAIILDYEYYNNLSKELNEITKVSTSNMIEIAMNIEYTIENENGIVKELFKPTVIIPLSTSYFSILSTNMDSKAGDIKRLDTTNIPPNGILIFLYRSLIALIIIIIILVVFTTKNPSDYDLYILKIKKIFKNYGKLLIGINDSRDLKPDKICYIKSIEDLIKISDEIEKPIFYNNTDYISSINEFYIIDNEIFYIYKLNDLNIKNLEPVE